MIQQKTTSCPGATETKFSLVRLKGNGEGAKKVYKGYQSFTATDVANNVYFTTTVLPQVCINDLVVTCTQQPSSYYLDKDDYTNEQLGNP